MGKRAKGLQLLNKVKNESSVRHSLYYEGATSCFVNIENNACDLMMPGS